MSNIIADVVRRMVESFSADIEAVQIGVVDERTPEDARRILAAALAYLIEEVDLMPDSYQGIGIMDDAAIIRLAARAAVAKGASDAALHRLAAEAEDLPYIFGELVLKLQDYLDMLQRPNALGRTPADLITHPESRMELWRLIAQRRETSHSDSLAALAMDPSELVRTMRSVMRDRLSKLEPPG